MLVVGATGGVGTQAVQLATQAGAHVTATAASAAEEALVRDLGAAATVDHGGNLVDAVRTANPDGVDVVLHVAGDPAPLPATLRPGGRIVSTIIQPQQLPTDDATVIGIYTVPDPATLDRVAAAAAAGVTRLTIQASFPLEKASDALATFAGGTLGKVVITTA